VVGIGSMFFVSHGMVHMILHVMKPIERLGKTPL
jgi:hypothetical protein